MSTKMKLKQVKHCIGNIECLSKDVVFYLDCVHVLDGLRGSTEKL